MKPSKCKAEHRGPEDDPIG